jgi:uncharacterized protein YcbK (DUF882 family)
MDYFPEKPWACRCGCGFDSISPELVEMLNRARQAAECAFTIVSACRCQQHNKAIGGEPGSAHCKGLAVDIRVDTDHQRFKMLSALLGVGFKRIGIAGAFIHADIMSEPSPRIRTY